MASQPRLTHWAHGTLRSHLVFRLGRVDSGWETAGGNEEDKGIPTTFHARAADDGRSRRDRQHGGHGVLEDVRLVVVVVVVVAVVAEVVVDVVVNEVGGGSWDEEEMGEIRMMRKGRDSEWLRGEGFISE